MLLNDVDTQGRILGLTEGIHQVQLFNLETTDPNDYIRIIGDSNVEFQWRYLVQTDWREPYHGNEFTEYADSIGQELRIVLNVISGGEFIFRTDDTFEYPNDDTPTNPVIDIEVLLQGSDYYSTVASDYLGSVDNNILSTGEGAVATLQIQESFFHNLVNLTSYGVEGSAALWVTEPGTQKVSLTVENAENSTLLLWDGEKLKPIEVTNGTQSIEVFTVSDEWGFVLLDATDASNNSSVSVDSIQWLSSNPVYNFTFKGDVEADVMANTYTIGTGTGDYAASTLGYELMGNRNYLKPHGREGSYIKFTDLENGVYEFNVLPNKIDLNNNDSFWVWNGKDLIAVADNENGLITNSVDIIYGELSFIAMDSTTTTGTTEFILSDLTRTGDLPYPAPVPINLTPDVHKGDVENDDDQTRISTGTGDVAISTIARDFTGDYQAFDGYGTEGSYATWLVENGIYEINYYLYTNEDDFDHDAVYFFNGTDLSLFASRSDATIQSSSTRWISDGTTQQVVVTNGELTFISLDTVDKSGTTQLRIGGIERVGENDNPHEPIYSEPPDPIPDNGKDLGNEPYPPCPPFKGGFGEMGTLKPWESDSNTGITWNQGYVYGTYHLGHSYINEHIGGNDVTDWTVFDLDEASYLNFYHSGAVAIPPFGG